MQKLERSEAEDLAGRYFRPGRASELLLKGHNDVHRALRKWDGKHIKKCIFPIDYTDIWTNNSL